MKTFFYWLLKRYSGTEEGRIKILRLLADRVSDDYTEQTSYGNVYNCFIELAMANPFIVRCTKEKDTASLGLLKWGIQDSFDEAIQYIENQNQTA